MSVHFEGPIDIVNVSTKELISMCPSCERPALRCVDVEMYVEYLSNCVSHKLSECVAFFDM